MSKLPFYRKHYAHLFEPLLDLMTHGVRVDVPRMKKRHAELRSTCKELAAELNRLTGADQCECGHGGEAHPAKRVNIYDGVMRKDGKPRVAKWKQIRVCKQCRCEAFAPKQKPLVTSKDISNAKLAAYLYDRLGLPEQKAPRGEGERTRTANELACRKLRRMVLEFLAQPAFTRGKSGKPPSYWGWKLEWRDYGPKRFHDEALKGKWNWVWVEQGGLQEDPTFHWEPLFPTKETDLAAACHGCDDQEILKDLSLGRRSTKSRYRVRWKRTPKRTLRILDAVLRHRRASKLSTFVNVKKVDADGRMRCSYKFTTITGRLSSSKNPLGGGYNLQNVDREIRDCFVPDHENWFFVEADYSQGETRLLYALTGEPELIRLAQAPPSKVDTYVETAARMFQVPVDKVTKEQRRAGKETTLASGYGMGAWLFAQQLALKGLDVSEEQCEAWLAAYFEVRGGVLLYQKWIRTKLIRERLLRTCWGRELNVKWARLSKEVYKQGYAFMPQSTLGDALNQLGLIPMHEVLTSTDMRSKINLQVHDALVLSCPAEEVHKVMSILSMEMTAGLELTTIEGTKVVLKIPVELKLGRDWSFKGGFEFKQLPSEKEVKRCLRRLG